MTTKEVVMVRIYITEASHVLDQIIHYLKHEIKIRGVSVFRAISGYGDSGDHTSSLVDLSLNLPLVVEFFDTKAQVAACMDHLNAFIKPEHIITWDATSNNF